MCGHNNTQQPTIWSLEDKKSYYNLFICIDLNDWIEWQTYGPTERWTVNIQCYRMNRTIIHIYEQIHANEGTKWNQTKPNHTKPFKHTPNKGYIDCNHTRLAAGIARYYFELHDKILLVFKEPKESKMHWLHMNFVVVVVSFWSVSHVCLQLEQEFKINESFRLIIGRV